LAEVVADAKYGTTANYTFLEKEGIAASIPLHATKATYRAVTIDAFTYDEARDQYRCPEGQVLRRQGQSATAGRWAGSSIGRVPGSAPRAPSRRRAAGRPRRAPCSAPMTGACGSGRWPSSELSGPSKASDGGRFGSRRCSATGRSGEGCAEPS